ncbi:trehalose-6-phosphate synthase [Actinoplanes sp. NPDC026619]|uniref:alpha,alpha-trehalose-phosphate synthase (UDP-forming) n=1 Tax=Actinoplanes sp. NPDC026619 TaxID=3155798 RepID=UPI0033D46EE1
MVADLVIAANRGPGAGPGGPPAAGGLAAVISGAVKDREAVWIHATTEESRSGWGWTREVVLSPHDYETYYNRVSNRALWLLQHRLAHLSAKEEFDFQFREDWRVYQAVNSRFAAACDTESAPGARVLVQDYHLALVPALLRDRRPDLRTAHFTACPWVDPEYFAMLPRPARADLISGMLGADLLGFSVTRWCDNFLACCSAADLDVDPGDRSVLAPDGRRVPVRAFPVGVDGDDLRSRARTPEVDARCRELRDRLGDQRLFVRVERLDPTKNLLRGLAGYELMLAADPALCGTVTYLVHAYPSRPGMPEYQRYASAAHDRVRYINDTFGTPDWTPCLLDLDDDPAAALSALRTADVIVVNPVLDAMNLVAKEGPVIAERDPVLILSEGAGAADELGRAASVVNPYDTAELAETMAAALRADPTERARRAAELRVAAVAMPPREWLAAQLRLLPSHG